MACKGALTHLDLGQGAAAQVAFQDVEAVVQLCPAGFHQKSRSVLEPLDLVRRDRAIVAQMQLSGLEGGDPGAGITLEPGHDTVQMRFVLAPVFGVAHQNDISARLPVLARERAGADGALGTGSLR